MHRFPSLRALVAFLLALAAACGGSSSSTSDTDASQDPDAAAGVDGSHDGAPRDADMPPAEFEPKTTCSTPVKVSDNGDLAVATFAVLTSEPGGRAVLGYVDAVLNTTTRVVRARLFDGGAWGPLANLGNTDDAPRRRNMAIDPGGNAILGFTIPDDVSRRRFAGGEWQAAEPIGVPLTPEAVAVAFVSPTRPLSISGNIGSPQYALYDGTWPALAPLESDATNNTTMELQRTTGGAVAVWADLDQTIRARFLTNAGLRDGVGSVASQNTVGVVGQIATAPLPGGDALVAWYRYSAGPTRELLVSTLSYGAQPEFSAPTPAATAEEFVNVQAIGDGSGDVTLLWVNETGLRATRLIDGTWSSPVTLGKARTETRYGAVDGAGHVTVLTVDDDEHLYHRRVAKGSSDWTEPHRIDTDAFPRASSQHGVGVTASGDVLAVWAADVDSPNILVSSICE